MFVQQSNWEYHGQGNVVISKHGCFLHEFPHMYKVSEEIREDSRQSVPKHTLTGTE